MRRAPRCVGMRMVLCALLSFAWSVVPVFADTNQQFDLERSIALPGRGIAVVWSPDGTRLAAGGHFRGNTVVLQPPRTNFRYDTKVYDVASGALLKNFDCHGFWVVALAWADVPQLGMELLADGGGDHAVKIWNADGPGSTSCKLGQYLVSD